MGIDRIQNRFERNKAKRKYMKHVEREWYGKNKALKDREKKDENNT